MAKHKLTGKGSVSYIGEDGRVTHRRGDIVSSEAYKALPERQQAFFEETSEAPGEEGAPITATEAAAELATEHDLDLKALVKAGDIEATGKTSDESQKVLQSNVEAYLEKQEE